MFYYISGTVAVIEPQLAVIDAGGLGYACHTTMKTIGTLTMGGQAKLYTYCHIREDAFDIYGFATPSELGCFKLLIGVSGVGPKAALSILSSATPEDLAIAVVTGDEKALTIAPGIGKKIAQRIILELKDKISKEASSLESAGYSASLGAVLSGGKASDVMAALSVLGYAPAEINSALKSVDLENLSTEEAIKMVLKNSLK